MFQLAPPKLKREKRAEVISAIIKFLSWLVRSAISRPRLAIEIALVAAAITGGWLYHKKARELEMSRLEARGLEAGLRQKLRLSQNQLEQVTRDLTGKVVVRKVYVPPEGSVVIKQKDHRKLMDDYKDLLRQLASADGDGRRKIEDEIRRKLAEMNKDDEIVVKDRGWTLRPGAGWGWAGYGIRPRGDIKVAYWKRWGLLFGGGLGGGGPAISRHIDDIVWGKLQNLEIYAGWNIPFQRDRRGWPSVGLRVNL